MEHLMWLGVNSEDNLISCHSVDAMSILPFLRGRDFCIEELSTLKENKEVNLLRPNEEPVWIYSDHYQEISWLLEKNDFEPIYSAKIKFKKGG